MKAYIAAPIFNPHQLSVVGGITNLLETAGIEFFSPYEASQAIWNGRAPKDCSPEERAQVLQGNIDNLNCDLLVAWVGGTENGKTDTGVVWEMGYANALGVPTLAFIHEHDVRDNMNLMLAGTVDGVVKGYEELDKALRLIGSRNPSGEWVTEDMEIVSILSEQFHPDRHIAHEKDPIV